MIQIASNQGKHVHSVPFTDEEIEDLEVAVGEMLLNLNAKERTGQIPESIICRKIDRLSHILDNLSHAK